MINDQYTKNMNYCRLTKHDQWSVYLKTCTIITDLLSMINDQYTKNINYCRLTKHDQLCVHFSWPEIWESTHFSTKYIFCISCQINHVVRLRFSSYSNIHFILTWFVYICLNALKARLWTPDFSSMGYISPIDIAAASHL